MHGYQLMKQTETLTEGLWMPSHSMLYKMLNTLENEGYVTSQKKFKGEVEKTVYSITKEGKAYIKDKASQLAHQLYALITSEQFPPFNRLSRSILPSFLSENLTPEEHKTLLNRIRAQLQKNLSEIDAEIAKLD